MEVLSMSVDVQPFITNLGFILLGASLICFVRGFCLTLKSMRGDNTDE